jgi:uncharacterized protein
MSIPILYLDALLLAAGCYPSGFSVSLFRIRNGPPVEVSTVFLGVLVIPYLVVGLGAWSMHPQLLLWKGTSGLMLGRAVFVAPVALAVEYGVHAIASYRANSPFRRRITVGQFWGRKLSPTDSVLLGTIVVGEEIVYRIIWFGALHYSFFLPAPLALGISSLAYGLNHLAFGWTTVLSKTITGLVYGSLYLLGRESLLLPDRVA